MTVPAGNLSERVTVQRPTGGTDAYGGQVEAWTDLLMNVRASVRALSGRDETRTEALTDLATHSVLVRMGGQAEQVDATCRVVWRNRLLRIVGVTADRLRRTVEMQCESGAGVTVGGSGTGSPTDPDPEIPPDLEPLEIGGSPAEQVTVGSAYSFTPFAEGGTPPYSFAISGPALLPGFTFDPTTGTLATTAALATGEMAGISITVTDAEGTTAVLPPFLVVILAVVIPPIDPPPPTTGIWWVNPVAGNDDNTGLSLAQAFANVPGEAAATGVAAATVLAPGDTVRFVNGHRRRTTLRLPFGGAAGNPITYDGGSWTPDPRARHILDGADPATLVRPATSQADAGGALNWADLHIVEFTENGVNPVRLYDDLGLMTIGAFPARVDPIFEDDINELPANYVEFPGAGFNGTGIVTQAEVAAICADQIGYARLNVWCYGNGISRATVESVAGAQVVGGAWTGGTNTSQEPYLTTTRVYVTNSRHHCTLPGSFATIGPGKAVVKLRGNSNIRIGNSRVAIDLNGKSHVRVTGFEVTGHTQAQVIRNTGATCQGAEITRNWLHDMYCERVGGNAGVVLNASNAIGLVLDENRFENLMLYSTFRGPPNGLRFRRNVVRRIGGSALGTSGATDGMVIEDNIVSEAKGVHANGLYVYQDARNARVAGNIVFDTLRPFTFQGEADGMIDHGHVFTRNVFLSSGESTAMWNNGRPMRGLTVTDNLAIAAKKAPGILLYRHNDDVTVSGNSGNSLSLSPPAYGAPDLSGGWSIGAFTTVARTYVADVAATLTADNVNIPHPAGGAAYALDLRTVAVA